jgi:hypothetical protein
MPNRIKDQVINPSLFQIELNYLDSTLLMKCIALEPNVGDNQLWISLENYSRADGGSG